MPTLLSYIGSGLLIVAALTIPRRLAICLHCWQTHYYYVIFETGIVL